MANPNEWLLWKRVCPRILGVLVLAYAAFSACAPGPVVPAPPPRVPPPPVTPSPRFDQVRTLVTHNSYSMSFDGWFDVQQESSNSYILDQLLYHRVRAFELDLHPPSNNAIYHNNAGQANCQHLDTCLDIFRGYHRMNPDHDVITIYIHLLEAFTTGAASMDGLDDLIRQKLGGLVYTPQQAVARCPSIAAASPANAVREAVEQCAWPTMAELRGKFIFAIHQAGIVVRNLPGLGNISGYRANYKPTRQVFIGGVGSDTDESTDVFIINASNARNPDWRNRRWRDKHIITREWGSMPVFDPPNSDLNIPFYNHIMINGLYNNFEEKESATKGNEFFWPYGTGWGRIPWDYNNLRKLDGSNMLPLFTWSYQCLPENARTFSLLTPPYPDGCEQGEPAFRGPSENEPFYYLAYWPEKTHSIWVQAQSPSIHPDHYGFYALPEASAEDFFVNLTASISAPSGFQSYYKELDTDDPTDTIPSDNPKKQDRGCLMARASAAPGADYFAICRNNFIDSIEVVFQKGGVERRLIDFEPYKVMPFGVDTAEIAPKNVKIFAQLEKTREAQNCYRGLVTDDGATGQTRQRGLLWDASLEVCFDAPLKAIGLAVRAQFGTHAGYLFGNVKRNAGITGANGPRETLLSAEAFRPSNVGFIGYSLAKNRTHLPSAEYDFAITQPPRRSSAAGVRRVDAGPFHTCAIVPSPAGTGGQVRCWGDNKFGQLGDGTTVSRSEPGVVLTPKGAPLDRVLQISAGGDCGVETASCTPEHPQYQAHTCALVAPGPIDDVNHSRVTIWCWGANAHHQLGNDTTSDSKAPVLVNTTTFGSTVSSISAGGYHNCLLTGDGQVACWGRNHKKQARNSPDATIPHPEVTVALSTRAEPTPTVIAVRAGGEHSCAVYPTTPPAPTAHYDAAVEAEWQKRPQKIVCWGANESGQGGSPEPSPLGLWTPAFDSGQPMFPTQLALGSKVSVMIGTTVPYGGYQESQLWGWGTNTSNMLAVDHAQLQRPTSILLGYSMAYRSTVSKDIAAGWSHVCYTQRPGAGPGAEREIWCSGTDRTLAAGEASVEKRTNPAGVGRPIELTAGVRHTCTVYQDPVAPNDWTRSKVACWGENASGQVGVKDAKVPEPVLVPAL